MNWFEAKNIDQKVTPSLLVYPDRIDSNIKKMIDISSHIKRLRPHIKTHKIEEIVQLQQKQGIQKFKCATIAEAELLGQSKGQDILLAMPITGLDIERFSQLIAQYPESTFATLIDHPFNLSMFTEVANKLKRPINLYLDVNNGMNRTGIKPGAKALELCKDMVDEPMVNFMGLHIYDGHIHDEDLEQRIQHCNHCFTEVEQFINTLKQSGVTLGNIIAGGTPTFPIHNLREDVELSPGTPLLWDSGYSSKYKDLEFKHAAVIATRVISHPSNNLICLDLGHKSIASEMPLPRVSFLNLRNAKQVNQSEEHLVVQIEDAYLPPIGTVIYALPIHICPTVSKYPKVLVCQNNHITEEWLVKARDQKITI